MQRGVPSKYRSPIGDFLAPSRRPLTRAVRRTFARRTLQAALLLFAGSLSSALFASSALGATASVGLGSAAPFSVLAGSTVTNTGPTTMFGDLGLSPGSSVTGAPQVLGQTYVDDPVAVAAKGSLTTAFNDAASRESNGSSGTELSGQTFSPGVRTASSSLLLSSGAVTLDAEGNPDAVFIFQIPSTLITGSNTTVSLIDGAQACNVFWEVGSSATLGAGTHFVGTIMAAESITAGTLATIHGRLLAQTAAVTLEDNVITTSNCASSVSGSGGGSETSTSEETAALEAAGTTTAVTPPVGATTTTPVAKHEKAAHARHKKAAQKRKRARRAARKHKKRHRSPARPELPHKRGSFTG